jgi:hypothetical protein
MSVVFAIIGLWPVIGGELPRYWSIAIAVLFTTLALFVPRVLYPLCSLWLKLGDVLHRVTNPIILGAVFFLAVVPTGLLMRLFGKDPLSLELDPACDTYWVVRDPPGPDGGSMRNQF